MNSEVRDRYMHRGMLGHVVIEKTGANNRLIEDPWPYTLSSTEQRFIQSYASQDKRVVASVNFLSFMGMVSNGRSNTVFLGLGYDIAEALKLRGERWKWDAVAGEPLYLFPGPVALLGSGLARHLDCDLSEDLNLNLNKDGSLIAKKRPFSCPGPNVQLSVTTEQSQVNAMNLRVEEWWTFNCEN